MEETVKINDLTLCHKHADEGFVRSTLPDVCRAPASPAPYTNTAYAVDLENGTTTVRSHHGAMNGVKGSRFFPSYGDEPGTGGGVISGVNQHEATWLSWSPNVFMEGRAVTRLTDKMLLNRGNTVSIGGYYAWKPKDERNRPLLDKLCGYVCDCIASGDAKQSCVDSAIRADPSNYVNGIIPQQGYYQNGLAWPLFPQDWPGPGKPAVYGFPDVSKFSGVYTMGGVQAFGSPEALVEIKMPSDRFRGESGGGTSLQRSRYDSIADSYGIKHETIGMDKNPPSCECGETEKQKQTARVPARQPDTQSPPISAPPAVPMYCYACHSSPQPLQQ